MELEYFQIREDDVEILNQIKETALSSYDDFDAVIFAKYNRIYACVEGNDLVGCCVFVRDFANPDTAFFYGTTMTRRDKSVTRKLMDISFADLKDTGISYVELFIDAENIKGIRAYKDNYGFEIKAKAEDEPDVGEYIILRKAL